MPAPSEIVLEMTRKTMRYRYAVLGIAAFGYFLVFFHRMSTAVMAPDLSADFGLGPAQVGLFGSMYFYAYAMSQLPSGILADRWGARKTTSLFLLIAGSAALLFGIANTFTVALGARFFVGLGVAFMYVPTLRLLADWFRADEYATYVGFMVAVGNSGALAASAPLAALMITMGWRSAIICIGFITILTAALLYIVVRNKPEEIGGINPNKDLLVNVEPIKQMSVSQVIKVLIRKYNFWTLAILYFGWAGILMSIQGLWSGPYLMNVYHLSKQEASSILMFIAIGAIIGCPLIGFFSDRVAITKKKLVMIGVLGTILTLVPLVFFIDTIPLGWMRVLMFMFGLFSYSNLLIWPNLKDNVEATMLGTASGFLNLFGFMGGAIFQQIMGIIIARAPMAGSYLSTNGFKAAFLFCLVYLIFGLMVFSTQKEAA